jgi:hypothetical protein
MNQKASRIAIAYQSCFKYVLSYHAEKKCWNENEDVHGSTFKVVIRKHILFKDTIKQ